MHFKMKKLEEAGYSAAMYGLALNKKKDPADMHNVAMKLSPLDSGHNKFLESMIVWFSVSAPRYWWQEADTYRLSTKQSESTMHTLVKELKEKNVDISSLFECEISNELKSQLGLLAKYDNLMGIKQILPEGFIQEREWCMSYKTLKNIIAQRSNHRVPHWKEFCKEALLLVDYPQFLSATK